MRNVKINADNWMLYTKELEYLGYDTTMDKIYVYPNHEEIVYLKDLSL